MCFAQVLPTTSADSEIFEVVNDLVKILIIFLNKSRGNISMYFFSKVLGTVDQCYAHNRSSYKSFMLVFTLIGLSSACVFQRYEAEQLVDRTQWTTKTRRLWVSTYIW